MSWMMPGSWFLAERAIPLLYQRNCLPGVGKSRIVANFFVCQRLKKCNEIRAILPGKFKTGDQRVLVRIVMAVSRFRSRFYGPASRGVVVEDTFKRRNAAIVHIGPGDGDVPQRGSLELSDVRGNPGVLVRAHVGSRIGEQAGNFVKPRIVKLDLSACIALRNRGIAEIETTVATEARKVLVEEQYLPALGEIGHSTIVAAVMIAVIRRPGGDDTSLEGRECFSDVLHRETVGVVGKRPCEKELVSGVGMEHRQKAIAFLQAQLDRVNSEHRHQNLVLKFPHLRVAPGQHGAV